MFSYGLKEEYKSKKVDVTYYRMNCDYIISNVFTKYAREKIYFRNEDNNKLYYLVKGKKVVVPFTYNNDLFYKCVHALYPIGTIISDKTDANKNGEVLYYIMESNKYVVRNGSNNMSIHFDNAIVNDYYYFISSVGKVQIDIVGRDLNIDTFRKKSNNYFETKKEANLKLFEIYF